MCQALKGRHKLRFWEGRYKCQPILDESALAACLAYVDLNPMRARIARTPEESRFTSVFERIQALAEGAARLPATEPRASGNEDGESGTAPEGGTSAVTESRTSAHGECESGKTAVPRSCVGLVCGAAVSGVPARDGWLSPICPSESEDLPAPVHRASNKGCLEMSLADYLRLLDWTGRQLRRDKRGAIPADVAPVLERLQMGEEGWIKIVSRFSRLFRRAAGTPQSLAHDAQSRGKQRREGIAASAGVFA